MDKRQEWLEKLRKLRQTNILPNNIQNVLIEAIYDWFEYFQGDEDAEKMVELYEKLVEEERNEIYQAWNEMDVKKLIDAYIDTMWVKCWETFFSLKAGDVEEDTIKEAMEVEIDDMLNYVNIPYELLMRAIIEVAYSNWTKSKEKIQEGEKKGKIIKWPDWVAPDWDFVFRKLTK